MEVRCEGRAKTQKIHRFVRKSKLLLGSSICRDLLTHEIEQRVPFHSLILKRYTVG